MATSTRSADTVYLVRKAMGVGYQLTSLMIPPLYTVLILARRGRGALSINRLLRATWLGGLGGKICLINLSLCLYLSSGGLTCGGLAYGWYARSDEELVRTTRLLIANDVLSFSRCHNISNTDLFNLTSTTE